MEKFTRLFVCVALALPVFAACNISSRNTIRGNYQVINKEIPIADYDEIVVGLAADVVYQQFSDSIPYLQITTDDNILSALNVRVEGTRLVIETKADSVIHPTQLTIYTHSRNLNNVHVQGSGEIYLRGEVNAKNFNLNISGSGNVRTDSVLCENLQANISGSGNAQLTGAAKESAFMVSGSGNINAYDFLVLSSKCTVSGSGNIKAYSIGHLDASIYGSGNITYKGIPESVNSFVSGSGKIKQTE
jgi:hypothetical protein